MKRIPAIAILLIASLVAVYSQNRSDEGLIEQLKSIMDDYSVLVENYSDNSNFRKAYDEFLKNMKVGKISLNISTESIDSLLSGLRFDRTINENNVSQEKAYLTFHSAAIENYENNTSIIYSMITHELWHAYAFSQWPNQVKEYHTDPFEEIMYEADAYYVEAEFIEKVLVERKIALSKFETYLLKCYQENALSSFLIVFMHADLSLIRTLYDLRNGYTTGTIKIDEVYNQLINLGKTIIENYIRNASNDGKWEWYVGFTIANTYQKYMTTLINQIEKGRKTWGEVFADYSELQSVYLDIRSYIDKEITKANEYNNRVLSLYKIPI